MMTTFQEECIRRCKNYLGLYSLQPTFKEVDGDSETIHVAEFAVATSILAIHIYAEQAGIMINNRYWMPFEAPDYAGEDELISALLKSLFILMSNITESPSFLACLGTCIQL